MYLCYQPQEKKFDMILIEDVCKHLESIAPPSYQESYDNSTLITGNYKTEISGILLSLDCTEEIVDEAINTGCNLIVAHHPIVFKGLKSFTGKNYVERTIIKAIKNDIAIFSCHTNLDHVFNGVNKKICDKLELINTTVLAPKTGTLKKLTVFVPQQNAPKLLDALHNAGAGNIGNYEQCSFKTNGIGSFKPTENATPHIGEKNTLEHVEETKIELIVPSPAINKVVNAMHQNHPYEEVAYYITPLENLNHDIGAGMIGSLKENMTAAEFISHLKDKMGLKVVKHTKFIKDEITSVAVCGGSGSFLLNNAISKKADIFITADFKYHEFFDAEDKIVIADIGHYESEVFTKDLFYEIISKKFTNIAVRLSEVNTNPIVYA